MTPEGYSNPAQREACKRKTASLDAAVIEELVDRGESARTADRPELRLLDFVLDNRVTYVIVHKIDRLARNRADDVAINVALKQAGVQPVSVTQNIDEKEIRTGEVDPERGPLKAWAFEVYATGEWTIRTLLDELTARRLISAPTPKKPAKPLARREQHPASWPSRSRPCSATRSVSTSPAGPKPTAAPPSTT